MKLNGDPYYSPQFNRRSLGAVFSCQVLQIYNVGMDVDIEHKNVEDTTWTVLASLSVNTVITDSVTTSGIKEQVRYKYTLSAPNPYHSIQFLMQEPSWAPY